jgi:deoxyribodipyrimidine photo-lyase
MLQDFIDNRNRLRLYDTFRNEPNFSAQSQLSPWLHFGQIAPQRCALETAKYLLDYDDAVQWFYEGKNIIQKLKKCFNFVKFHILFY